MQDYKNNGHVLVLINKTLDVPKIRRLLNIKCLYLQELHCPGTDTLDGEKMKLRLQVLPLNGHTRPM
jgi:hypothetical protein